MTNTNGLYAETRDMYKVHAMFRREFGLLPGLVPGVTAGDNEHSQIVTDHITLLTTVLHAHHHSEDESLWPKLLDRGSEEVAPVVHLMESQHESLDKLITEIATEIGAWRSSAASERGEALADAIDRMIPVLYEHMGSEEERTLPIVERYITAAEWEEMVQNGWVTIPPEDGPLVVGMLMYEGGLELVPPEARSTMGELAPRMFASHSMRVHGTATPPRSTEVSHLLQLSDLPANQSRRALSA